MIFMCGWAPVTVSEWRRGVGSIHWRFFDGLPGQRYVRSLATIMTTQPFKMSHCYLPLHNNCMNSCYTWTWFKQEHFSKLPKINFIPFALQQRKTNKKIHFYKQKYNNRVLMIWFDFSCCAKLHTCFLWGTVRVNGGNIVRPANTTANTANTSLSSRHKSKRVCCLQEAMIWGAMAVWIITTSEYKSKVLHFELPCGESIRCRIVWLCMYVYNITLGCVTNQRRLKG